MEEGKVIKDERLMFFIEMMNVIFRNLSTVFYWIAFALFIILIESVVFTRDFSTFKYTVAIYFITVRLMNFFSDMEDTCKKYIKIKV